MIKHYCIDLKYCVISLFGHRAYYLKTSEIPDLVVGWAWLGRKKDNSCHEWRIWITFILYSLSPWIILHSVVLFLIKLFYNKVIKLQEYWLIIVTILCLHTNFGLLPVLLCAGMTLIYYFLMFTNNKLIIWTTSILLLGFWCNNDYLFEYFDPNLNEEMSYLLLLTVYWHNLRCLSFVLSFINLSNKTESNYTHFLAYSFYLPCFFFGPIMIYEKLIPASKNNDHVKTFKKRSVTLIIKVMRCLFWMLVVEFVLHFIYINVFLQNIKVLKKFGIIALSGFGFTMGQFFFIKYTVVYGLAIAIAEFDEYIEPPKPPKCISRIHLYSDMWRSFDEGLYKFLKTYIYIPSGDISGNVGLLTKIYRSFLCFAFVFIWHGLSWEVFLWTTFNYIGITIETLAKYIGKTQVYIKYVKGNLQRRNEKRLLALLTSPLTMMSAISNFFFFGGIDAGMSFFEVIFLQNTWIQNSIIIIIFYCMCNISMEFEDYRKAKQF
ncbi:protein-cysteine N-palmitoyltransferase Rasp isoform X2 [Daktulosphaira vitifoliae]|uniref:protein-cysteine N-palmitoyltransferase Rasp isoform X2 n=1 Tax=Daktulosphaira vitifoliae TaxID=58002 RepID=UPI0021AAC3C1|nr:protein-cysteine N-palmitoyltransferase Rasp isoform X2 [Daktulosphaira vitifoliae]